MEDTLEQTAVDHNEGARRFEARVGDAVAFLDYRRVPKTLHLIHTEVPAELEGRGLASALARAALNFARHENLRVVPSCAFVAGYIDKHPEYAELVRQR